VPRAPGDVDAAQARRRAGPKDRVDGAALNNLAAHSL
jgi:hypothetical protein